MATTAFPPCEASHNSIYRRAVNTLGQHQGQLNENEVFYKLDFGARAKQIIAQIKAFLEEEGWTCDGMELFSVEVSTSTSSSLFSSADPHLVE
jgi:hypothetical protein